MHGRPSRPREGERSAEMALGACEAPLRAVGTPGRFSRRPTSLAIGTIRLSALHHGIFRTGARSPGRLHGLTWCPVAPRARWSRTTAAGSRPRLRLQARLRKTPLDEQGWRIFYYIFIM